MANHDYIISEVQFFNEKENGSTWDFVSGSGIDLAQSCVSKIPTLAEIKTTLTAIGLKVEELYEGNTLELWAKKDNDDEVIHLIFAEYQQLKDQHFIA